MFPQFERTTDWVWWVDDGGDREAFVLDLTSRPAWDARCGMDEREWRRVSDCWSRLDETERRVAREPAFALQFDKAGARALMRRFHPDKTASPIGDLLFRKVYAEYKARW